MLQESKPIQIYIIHHDASGCDIALHQLWLQKSHRVTSGAAEPFRLLHGSRPLDG